MGAGKTIVYRLFVPKNYQAGRKYPLMLTLHGAGERGSDDSLQLYHDFNRMWASDSIQNAHPCFVVAPQCPKDSQWVNTPWAKGSYELDKITISEPMKSVVGILDSLEKEFNIDRDRVYLSGISMGGYGTWFLAMKYPTRFAAAVPVCGGADPRKAPDIAKLPIWTFHAEDDGTVPVAGTREMVAALKAAGSSVKYTEYPKALGINHASWVPAGKTPELVPWVFQQVRSPVSLLPFGTAPGAPGSAKKSGEEDRTDALGKTGRPDRHAPPGFSCPVP
ncbi:MAG: esterase [Fibrobacteres bacterium]|nr:esterase [Fibrobacterota bacterium]